MLAAGRRAETWTELVTTTWPEAQVVLVRADDDPSETHARLAATGPFDVILQDDDTSAFAQVRLFQRLFFHLREGGAFLTPELLPWGEDDDLAAAAEHDAVQREDGPRAAPYQGDLWSLVAAAQAARVDEYVDRDDLGLAAQDLEGLGRRLREIWVRTRALRITAGVGTSQPKLTEGEADRVLQGRTGIGDEVASVPPAHLRAGQPVVHNLAGEDPFYSDVTPAPKMTLRRYDAPVCSRGQVVTSQGLLLPDTFRFPTSPRMTNIYVEEEAPRFGHVRRDVSEPEDLPGVWFHLDSEWPGQFGHMMTERMGRIWAWRQVQEAHPDVQVLMTPHDRPPHDFHPYELELFDAWGISTDDIRLFDDPVRPEVLYSATSMFSLSAYVHPELTEVWRTAGDRLAARARVSTCPPRLFVTRPQSLKRACHNAADVELLFERHGFVVLRPEELSLAEQVVMVRSADVVGGFVGSGLFTLALCPEPKKLFTVGPDSYTARNEQLIAAALGHSVVASWSRADIPHPPGSWSQEAFFSDFAFDPDREGVFLEEQLARLDS